VKFAQAITEHLKLHMTRQLPGARGHSAQFSTPYVESSQTYLRASHCGRGDQVDESLPTSQPSYNHCSLDPHSYRQTTNPGHSREGSCSQTTASMGRSHHCLAFQRVYVAPRNCSQSLRLPCVLEQARSSAVGRFARFLYNPFSLAAGYYRRGVWRTYFQSFDFTECTEMTPNASGHSARPIHLSRPYPGDDWRQLTPQAAIAKRSLLPSYMVDNLLG
jgi:hypothetical protein